MKKMSFQSMGSGFRAYGIPHFQVPNPFWNWMSETKKHGCDHGPTKIQEDSRGTN
jgi:hypothetical protein